MMKKTLSLLCCLLMLLQLFSVTALADEGEPVEETEVTPEATVVENPEGAVYVSTEDGDANVVVNGDINSTEGGPALYVGAHNGEGEAAVVTVNGDVTASSDEENYYVGGVDVYADDGNTASVTVNGNVTASGKDWTTGVDAYGDGTASVTVNGDVSATGRRANGVGGVGISNKDEVTINGDVTASGDDATGVQVHGKDSKTTVNGNVTASGKDFATGVVAYEKGEATINGNVTASGDDATGVNAIGGGKVTVNGDVTGGVEVAGYSWDDSDDESKGLVAVEGTVKPGSKGYALNVNTGMGFDYEVDESVIEIDTDSIPVIEVGKLEANKDGEFYGLQVTLWTEDKNEDGSSSWTAEPVYLAADEETEQYLKENVRYLVSEDMAAGEMNVDGTKQSEQTGSDYALEDDTLTVKLSLDPGYRLDGLKAGEYADVKQNADGSYTVTVKRGGDLNLQALLAAAMFKTEYAEAELFGAKPGDSLDDAMRAVAATFRGNKKIRFDTMNSLIVGAELKAFNKLDGEQKLLVMMNLLKLAIGQDVDTEGLSKEAAALVTKLAERLGAMSAEARLAKLSRVIQVKDGKAVIDLRIGATHQRFSFNAEDGSFISAENGAFVLQGYDRLY